MKVFEILNVVEGLKYRDKWHKGVKAYAVEMLEKICKGDIEQVTKDTEFSDLRLSHVTRNGDGETFKLSDRNRNAKEIVKRACYSGSFLISNEDICNRLCTKRTKANKHEYEFAMDNQVTAVWWALGIIWRIATGMEYKSY